MEVIELGQFMLAIDTQERAVIVPIPWEIINAGGTIIDNGLSTDKKFIFAAWTIKRRVIIRRICLELLEGFSFLETKIKNPQLIRISMNFKNHNKISDNDKEGIRSNL